MTALYDTIGKSYRDFRRPDSRIAAMILDALGEAGTIVNIGAGAGSYEPRDRDVVAVEPSTTMIGQRLPNAAPVVRASALNLPFRDNTFDGALAIFTVHHWPDQMRGLAEMRRVAARAVILTWEPVEGASWLTRDYFPEILERDRHLFPRAADLFGRAFAHLRIEPVPVPHDCSDGFLEAYWRRPEAYLDPGVRGAISPFATMRLDSGLERLRRDLEDGTWRRRNGHLLSETERDLGYRLVIGSRN